jgi:hypothetical protein
MQAPASGAVRGQRRGRRPSAVTAWAGRRAGAARGRAAGAGLQVDDRLHAARAAAALQALDALHQREQVQRRRPRLSGAARGRRPLRQQQQVVAPAAVPARPAPSLAPRAGARALGFGVCAVRCGPPAVTSPLLPWHAMVTASHRTYSLELKKRAEACSGPRHARATPACAAHRAQHLSAASMQKSTWCRSPRFWMASTTSGTLAGAPAAEGRARSLCACKQPAA